MKPHVSQRQLDRDTSQRKQRELFRIESPKPIETIPVAQKTMVNGAHRSPRGKFEPGNRHVAVHWDAPETPEEIKIAYGKF